MSVQLIGRGASKAPRLLTSIVQRGCATNSQGTQAAGSSVQNENLRKAIKRREYRYVFPEFLPDPNPLFRDHLREKLEREDMLKRREVIEIPEFYVGSIVAFTIADPNVGLGQPVVKGVENIFKEKKTRFLGIVIARGGCGLRAWCIVRNVIDGQGIEFRFELYAPTIRNIEVIRLEKRLDDELYYLRDAHKSYSTFPQNMETEFLPDQEPVPVNDVVVPVEDGRRWTRNWHLYSERLEGLSTDGNSKTLRYKPDYPRHMNQYMRRLWQMKVVKFDLMKDYRETIPIEEQDKIWASVGPALEERDRQMKRAAAKRSLSAKKI